MMQYFLNKTDTIQNAVHTLIHYMFYYQILVSAGLEPHDQNLLGSSTTVSIYYL